MVYHREHHKCINHIWSPALRMEIEFWSYCFELPVTSNRRFSIYLREANILMVSLYSSTLIDTEFNPDL